MQATTEWKRGHIWDILATVQPHSFGLGISAPTPLFPSFVWKGTAVLYQPCPDYRGFKIPSFASRCHSSICAPPPAFSFSSTWIFSSTEPLGSQCELIVYPSSRRPSVRPSVRRRRKQFQTSSSPKPLGRSKPNFMWSLLG